MKAILFGERNTLLNLAPENKQDEYWLTEVYQNGIKADFLQGDPPGPESAVLVLKSKKED